MDKCLLQVKEKVYDKIEFELSDFEIEPESKEYDACQFQLNGLNIVCRRAKVTPKKVGQFVTFWKRKGSGVIEPFNETDRIDFFIVNVLTDNRLGQFVFPKSVLIKKGIISTDAKEGKRGFRVYPKWDVTGNKQAEITQSWQLNYFYELGEKVNLKRVIELYSAN